MDASHKRTIQRESIISGTSARNEAMRRIKHGPIRPMHKPTLLERFLGLR